MSSKTASRHTLSTLGLLLLVAGQLMPQMDFSIVNVALGSISLSLHASEQQLGLIISLYGLAFAVFLAISGRLGDRYGRKKVFLAGIGLFAVASFFCGLASTIYQLICARIAQGIAAALLMPQILATIHVVLKGARHSRAIGIYGSVGGLSFVVGQALGGWLVSANLFDLGWRSVFYINLPVCLLILWFGQKYIPETKQSGSLSFDVMGTLLLALVISLILAVITFGPDWHWQWPVWGVTAIIVPVIWLLARVETNQAYQGKTPLIPPALILRPTVLTGIGSLMLQVASYGGFMFVVALTIQSGFHWSSLDSGNAFIGLGVTYFLASLYVNKIAGMFGRFSFSGVILCGSVLNLSGYTLLWYAMHTHQGLLTPVSLLLPMCITGIGNAFSVNSGVRISLSDIPAQFAGAGSALISTLQQTSIALGTALAGALFIQHLVPGDSHQLAALTAGLLVLAVFMLIQFSIHAWKVVRMLNSTPAENTPAI